MKWENSLQMVMYLIKVCPQKMYTKIFILALFIMAPNWEKKKAITIFKRFCTISLGKRVRFCYPESISAIP